MSDQYPVTLKILSIYCGRSVAANNLHKKSLLHIIYVSTIFVNFANSFYEMIAKLNLHFTQ